ncbi:DUF6503 family protein [Gillisia sp. Hel_I_29]|uniref:DUF6503 family protein n=1 Tax=Gillisia sp. Hel_I_29 TaxID=1249975 RepID=UPI00054E549D|nr:DUF6503 family protein [Gillisia sp. Hel_I_29]
MKNLLLVLSLVLFISSCQDKKEEITAQEIIDKTIEKSGGANYKKATIEFKFREHTYKSVRNGGEYRLERTTVDSTGTFVDVLSNTGFERLRGDSLVKVQDSMALRIGSSVNSVHYFANLPYGLNDRAVNKQLAGETIIKGEPYYQLKITFQQDGGGEDHHDEFMYWIHKDNFTVDYLAYKFHGSERGIRFRVVYNPRVIEGIRFVDYENYSVEDFNIDLRDLGKMYENGALEFVSNIENENVQVQIRK